jgi:hypothetical protein
MAENSVTDTTINPTDTWNKMFMEYITNEKVSYASLALKYGVSENTVEARGGREGWTTRRAETLLAAQKRLQDKAANVITAYKEKLGRAGVLASATALDQLMDKGIKPTYPKDILAYLVQGLKMEGDAIGFKSGEVQVIVNNQQQNNIKLVWGDGPAGEYQSVPAKAIETPKTEPK